MTHNAWIYLTSGKMIQITVDEDGARRLAKLVGTEGQVTLAGHVIDLRALDAVRVDPPLPEWLE